MSKMTPRQADYLILIIESFIEDGIPVSSSSLIDKYDLPISSATVRNEMNQLEHFGYLAKAHTSSGRVPSTLGYQYYATHIEEQNNDFLAKKLEDIFAKRRYSIDLTLSEAVDAISNLAGLTLVTSSSEIDELLKSIQLTPLTDKMATIVLVTSTGRVESKLLELNRFVSVEDVRIAVRIFKERLINIPLRELPQTVQSLAPILAQSVKNYEDLIRAFIGKIFDFHNRVTNKVYGNNELIKHEDISREDLANLINLIEHKSVWSSIEGKLDEDDMLKIDIRPNNTSIISKKINANGFSKEISIVGSNRIDYREAKQVLNLLEKFIKGDTK